VTLRRAIRVRDSHELQTWLVQNWVIDAYTEYAVAVLDVGRAEVAKCIEAGVDIPTRHRSSSRKFIINGATAALRERSAMYIGSHLTKTGWTRDNHDVRFVAQVVESGRLPGRWWQDRDRKEDSEALCAVAYRLMSWLRYMSSFTTSTHASMKYQRGVGFYWIQILEKARARRARQLKALTTDPGRTIIAGSSLCHITHAPALCISSALSMSPSPSRPIDYATTSSTAVEQSVPSFKMSPSTSPKLPPASCGEASTPFQRENQRKIAIDMSDASTAQSPEPSSPIGLRRLQNISGTSGSDWLSADSDSSDDGPDDLILPGKPQETASQICPGIR
jgi:hypothetical protein